MEREVWIRGGMVLSILALVVVILVTPTLLGRRSSELASVPLLIIGMDRNKSAFIVNIGAAVQAYQYDLVNITLNGSVASVNWTHEENESFGFHYWVPGNASFAVHVYLVDRERNYFEYNVSVRREKDMDNRILIFVTFPFEKDRVGTEVRTYPPDYFRQVIPPRGSLP